MKKEIKEKRKELDKKHSDYLYQVLTYVQKQGLSKYAYMVYRDNAIEMVYENQMNEEQVEMTFGKRGFEDYYTKKLRTATKKSVVEKIGSFLFAFFTLFFALALFIYIYRFALPINGSYYSSGIYLYVTATNLATMLIYGFLGALLSIFIQKNDKKTKYTLLAVTSALGLVSILTFFIIGSNYASCLKLNMIVVLLVTVALAVGGYFLEDLVSKKRCNVKDQAKCS